MTELLIDPSPGDAVILEDGSVLLLAGVYDPSITGKGNPWHDPRTGKFTFAPPGVKVMRGLDKMKLISNASRRLISQRSARFNGRVNAMTADRSGDRVRVSLFVGGRRVDTFDVDLDSKYKRPTRQEGSERRITIEDEDHPQRIIYERVMTGLRGYARHLQVGETVMDNPGLRHLTPDERERQGLLRKELRSLVKQGVFRRVPQDEFEKIEQGLARTKRKTFNDRERRALKKWRDQQEWEDLDRIAREAEGKYTDDDIQAIIREEKKVPVKRPKRKPRIVPVGRVGPVTKQELDKIVEIDAPEQIDREIRRMNRERRRLADARRLRTNMPKEPIPDSQVRKDRAIQKRIAKINTQLDRLHAQRAKILYELDEVNSKLDRPYVDRGEGDPQEKIDEVPEHERTEFFEKLDSSGDWKEADWKAFEKFLDQGSEVDEDEYQRLTEAIEDLQREARRIERESGLTTDVRKLISEGKGEEAARLVRERGEREGRGFPTVTVRKGKPDRFSEEGGYLVTRMKTIDDELKKLHAKRRKLDRSVDINSRISKHMMPVDRDFLAYKLVRKDLHKRGTHNDPEITRLYMNRDDATNALFNRRDRDDWEAVEVEVARDSNVLWMPHNERDELFMRKGLTFTKVGDDRYRLAKGQKFMKVRPAKEVTALERRHGELIVLDRKNNRDIDQLVRERMALGNQVGKIRGVTPTPEWNPDRKLEDRFARMKKAIQDAKIARGKLTKLTRIRRGTRRAVEESAESRKILKNKRGAVTRQETAELVRKGASDEINSHIARMEYERLIAEEKYASEKDKDRKRAFKTIVKENTESLARLRAALPNASRIRKMRDGEEKPTEQEVEAKRLLSGMPDFREGIEWTRDDLHEEREFVDPPEPHPASERKGGYSSDEAQGTNTMLGDEGERLFMEFTGGRQIPRTGKGKSRTGPFDVQVDGYVFEVKTNSTMAKAYKSAPKTKEQENKLKWAKEAGLEPATAMPILDTENNRVYFYWREGVKGGRLNDSWKYMGSRPIIPVEGSEQRADEDPLDRLRNSVLRAKETPDPYARVEEGKFVTAPLGNNIAPHEAGAVISDIRRFAGNDVVDDVLPDWWDDYIHERGDHRLTRGHLVGMIDMAKILRDDRGGRIEGSAQRADAANEFEDILEPEFGPGVIANKEELKRVGEWSAREGFADPPKSLKDYTTYDLPGAEGFQDELRAGGMPSHPDAQRLITDVDEFTSHRLKEPVVVYRGGRAAQIDGLDVGDEFEDLGYASTSLDRTYARSFIDEQSVIPPDERVALYRILLPRGHGAGFIDAPDVRNGHAGELEVLLPRGTRFRITSIDGEDVSLEAVPGERSGAEQISDELREKLFPGMANINDSIDRGIQNRKDYLAQLEKMQPSIFTTAEELSDLKRQSRAAIKSLEERREQVEQRVDALLQHSVRSEPGGSVDLDRVAARAKKFLTLTSARAATRASGTSFVKDVTRAIIESDGRGTKHSDYDNPKVDLDPRLMDARGNTIYGISRWDGHVTLHEDQVYNMRRWLFRRDKDRPMDSGEFSGFNTMFHEAQHAAMNPGERNIVGEQYNSEEAPQAVWIEESMAESIGRIQARRFVEKLGAKKILAWPLISSDREKEMGDSFGFEGGNSYSYETVWMGQAFVEPMKEALRGEGMSDREAEDYAIGKLKDIHASVGDWRMRLIAMNMVLRNHGARVMRMEQIKGIAGMDRPNPDDDLGRTYAQSTGDQIRQMLRRMGGLDRDELESILDPVGTQRRQQKVLARGGSEQRPGIEKFDVVEDGDIARISLAEHGLGDRPLVENEELVKGDSFMYVQEIRKGTWYINDVQLKEELRGRGLGKAMYRRAIEYAASRGGILESGSHTSDDAKRVWRSLVKSGEAEEFVEGKWRSIGSLRLRDPGEEVEFDNPTYSTLKEGGFGVDTHVNNRGEWQRVKSWVQEEGFSTDVDDMDAIFEYQEGAAHDIQPELRAGIFPPQEEAFIGQLDDYVSSHRMKNPVVAWRGTDIEMLGDLREGDEFKDMGYVSTTLSRSHAEFFVSPNSPLHAGGPDNERHFDPVLLRITVPRGHRGVYIDANNAMADRPGELELMLPRESRFRIDSIEDGEFDTSIFREHAGPVKIYRVTAIPSDDPPELSPENTRPYYGYVEGSAQAPERPPRTTGEFTESFGDPDTDEYYAGYQDAGDALRYGHKMTDEGQEWVDKLDAALSKSKAEEDMVLYRGMNIGALEPLELAPGDEFTDEFFASTSWQRNVAESYMMAGFGGPPPREGRVMFEISVPKGASVINNEAGDVEVLLDRGAVMKVNTITRGDDGELVYGVELVRSRHWPGKRMEGSAQIPEIAPGVTRVTPEEIDPQGDVAAKIFAFRGEDASVYEFGLGNGRAQSLNAYLRHGEIPMTEEDLDKMSEYEVEQLDKDDIEDAKPEKETLDELEGYIRNMDELIARSPLEEDTVLYRTVSGGFLASKLKMRDIDQPLAEYSLKELKDRGIIGLEWTDEGFVSTGTDLEQIETLSDHFFADGEMMKIIAPKGTPALDIEKFPGGLGRKGKFSTGEGTEVTEHVLPRGLRFRIVGVSDEENALVIEIVNAREVQERAFRDLASGKSERRRGIERR